MGRVDGGLKGKKATFITLEGLEGSGKSSVISFLERFLKKKGYSVKVFREPGSTKTGEMIRKILLDRSSRVSPYTELLLYLASRTQLIEEKLKKALNKYDFVICDRFFDSTIAYQGYGLGLGKVAYDSAIKFSLGVKPDLTIILDTDVKKGLSRIRYKDRIERRPLSFHLRIKKGYRILSKKYPRRIQIIDANKDLEEIFCRVKDIVEKRFFKRCRRF